MRIVRVKVFHQGTFESLLAAALEADQCLRYRGCYYQRVAGGHRAAIYRRSPHGLAWIQDRVDDYEFALFSRLLAGHCDRSGAVRLRTTGLVRQSNGAYRPRSRGVTVR